MAMWCCTDAVILGQMYEKQDPEKRKGSCMKIIAYFFFLCVVIIVFSCLGYDYYGRSSNRGMPLATISDIFYCESARLARGQFRDAVVPRRPLGHLVRRCHRLYSLRDPPQVRHPPPVLHLR